MEIIANSGGVWLPLILASAVGLALYDICKKHSVAGNRSFTVLLITSASGFLATLAMITYFGRLEQAVNLPSADIARLIFKSIIVSTSWSLAYWALKTLPVTVMAPIRATGPIWTTLAALCIFSEVPTFVQAIGFIFAFAGCIAFSIAAKHEGFTIKSASIVLAIGATLTGSASALYDKFLLSSAKLPADAVLLWFMGCMTIIYAIATIITRRIDKTPFEWRWSIPLVGVLLAFSDFMYFQAIGTPDAKISILSTIRRSSVIGTFLIGGAIFRETNLLRKGIALVAILTGVVILCLHG